MLKLHEMHKSKEIVTNEFVREHAVKLWGAEEIEDIHVKTIIEISRIENLDNLIVSCSFNSNERSFERAIFNTILKSNKNLKLLDKIEMAVEWNQYDIAKHELFDEKIDWVSYFGFFKLKFNHI